MQHPDFKSYAPGVNTAVAVREFLGGNFEYLDKFDRYTTDWDVTDRIDIDIDISDIDRLFDLTKITWLITRRMKTVEYRVTARVRRKKGKTNGKTEAGEAEEEERVPVYFHAILLKSETEIYEPAGHMIHRTGFVFVTEHPDFFLTMIGTIYGYQKDFFAKCFNEGGIYNDGRFSACSLKRLCCGKILSNPEIINPQTHNSDDIIYDDSTIPRTLGKNLDAFIRREGAKKRTADLYYLILKDMYDEVLQYLLSYL